MCFGLFFVILSISGCSGAGQGVAYQSDITLTSVEGGGDTIEFHIGSPLFLKMKVNTGQACEAFNGFPFFFDERGAQVGWGFEEVNDTLLFPDAETSCERFLMLTSESSNLLAEGYYKMSVSLLLNEKAELRSDTIVLHPIHATGANALSYSRFILEQIISNSPLLKDRETLRELFADHLPQSFTSDVYRAAISFRGGDISGTQDALDAVARRLNGTERASPLPENARRIYDRLQHLMAGEAR